MDYKIGDNVVHWSYGLGRVTAIEEKSMDGDSRKYYCVEVGVLALWVPFSETNDSPIRAIVDPDEFPGLCEILQSKAEELPEHQFLRKNLIKERLQKHTLAETCRIIRDLRSRAQHTPLNQNDSLILLRIESSLIDEWVLSLNIPRAQALQTLEDLFKTPEPPESQI